LADDLYYFTILGLEEVKTTIGRDTLEITMAPGRLLQEDRCGATGRGTTGRANPENISLAVVNDCRDVYEAKQRKLLSFGIAIA
jgi:hypothetical protein